ncbi:MAG: hypothetical protein J6Q63_00070 [Bacteroidales bacterium]|nr:hypothetical protein [Bacteroidales bacterium]
MKKLTAFVQEHIGDDLTRLILDRKKWPDIDMDLAVSCIQSRRKLKGKVQEWFSNPDLIFPVGLSAEQCSSSATGIYKSGLALRIADGKPFGLADLTGGLGVDSWYFSKKAEQVWYHEMQEKLCMAAEHNFQSLNAENIIVRNVISTPETIDRILSEARPDIVYMDPARRGEGGKKVFLIEECTPDVLTLKEQIFRHCRHILLKLSPMADITMACSRLGGKCREVHIVATGGECKELLIWMDREWAGEYTITAVELPSCYPAMDPATFSFSGSEEKIATASTRPRNDVLREPQAQSRDLFLFEPGKALMKAGCFNLIANRFGLMKLGVSTHYYVTESAAKADELKPYGKVYMILSAQPLDKRLIKAAGAAYPRAEVTARNIPMDTETLRKKLGVTSGDDAHIFGLKSDSLGNLLIITSRF